MSGKPGFFCEQDGSLSMRRLLALFFAVASIGLFWLAFAHAAAGWYVFLPGIACILASLLLLFFTTWADITTIVQAAFGIKPAGPSSGS